MNVFNNKGEEINICCAKFYTNDIPCDGRTISSDDIKKSKIIIMCIRDNITHGSHHVIFDTSSDNYEHTDFGGFTFSSGSIILPKRDNTFVKNIFFIF